MSRVGLLIVATMTASMSLGCATASTVRPSEVSTALAAKASSIRVLTGNDAVQCVTEIVGLVDVHESGASETRLLALLKLRAASLGADTVTNVELEHEEDGKKHLSGTAVRCNDLVHGRSYDVLARVEGRAEMGDEQAAFDDLRIRASRMRADLVIGVEFDHGKGEGAGTVVRGTAIRFRSGGEPLQETK